MNEMKIHRQLVFSRKLNRTIKTYQLFVATHNGTMWISSCKQPNLRSEKDNLVDSTIFSPDKIVWILMVLLVTKKKENWRKAVSDTNIPINQELFETASNFSDSFVRDYDFHFPWTLYLSRKPLMYSWRSIILSNPTSINISRPLCTLYCYSG